MRDTDTKPVSTVTESPRPAGTIVIQPGDSEADAWEKLREENSPQAIPATVKPTADSEDSHNE